MKQILFAVIACMPLFASAQQIPLPPGARLPDLSNTVMRDQVDRLKAVKKLPVHGLTMIETEDGKVFLLSDNGRLAIIGGRWVDLYEGKNIGSIDDAASLDKLNLSRMGIKVEDFAPWTIGSGPKRVTAFIDPLCDECRALVKQMPAMGGQYTFQVVLLPLSGGPSGLAARRMLCSPDKQLALDAMLNNAFESLPKDSPDCDVTPAQKALIAASVLGIRSVPYFIHPDFTVSTVNKGASKSLAQVLAKV